MKLDWVQIRAKIVMTSKSEDLDTLNQIIIQWKCPLIEKDKEEEEKVEAMEEEEKE